MSRNSLILCLSVLACMLVGIGVAVAFLYSGSDDAAETTVDEGRYLLLPAVPSDAVAVMCYSEADDVENHLFSKELFRAAKSSRAVVSVHHSGAGVLKPFYVFDAGRRQLQLRDFMRSSFRAPDIRLQESISLHVPS